MGALSILASQDKKTLKKINTLLKEIDREPFVGTGKPEPLRGQYSGAWSRRINEKDRIIYLIDGEHIYILSLKDHYDDK
jgi:toxin YoeB